MTNNLRPYPEYKDTGQPWLGQVPAHWNVPRLGAVLRERGENNDDGSVTDVLSVMRDRGVIPYAEKGNVGNKKSDDITRYKIVRPDDIVVNCMNVIIGSVGISRYTGCLSPVYYVLTRRSTEDNPAYLNAYFQTKPFQRSLVRIGNGILAHRMRIPMELLKCEPFPLPPPAEQAGIVRFLGAVDRKVNRFIRAKRRLIEVLTEQKQAIITHAVTKGLNPHAPLKPSGIDWLGDVPEHWEVKRLKWVVRLQRGYDLPADKRVSNGTVPVYSSGGMIGTHDHAMATAPGVVIGRYGSTEAVFFVEQDYWPHNTALFTTTMHGNHARWCYYLLRSISKADHAGKSAVPGVDRKDLYDIFVPQPPLREQETLAAGIDERLRELEAATAAVLREIDLIREYRTRLVADVVTGKVDVRGVVVPGDAGDAHEIDAAFDAAEADEPDGEGEDDPESARAGGGEEDA